jgi:membrane protein
LTEPTHSERISKALARRLLTVGGLNAKELLSQVWRRIRRDDVFGRSAQLSYFFILALFPLLIFLSMLLGYFFAAERHVYSRLLVYLSQVMPEPAFQVLRGTLNEITTQTDAGVLSAGLLFAVWLASFGMMAIIEGLNVAYEVPEARPWWRRSLVAILLTMALGVLVAAAFLVILASGTAVERVVQAFPLVGRLTGLSTVLQWTIAILFLLLALALIFRFAPNLRRSRWEGILPGALLTLTCWLAASAGMRMYLSAYNLYSRTYGSLGAVIILLVWLYLSGAAVLVGGELNSVIWQAVVRRQAPDSDGDRGSSAGEPDNPEAVAQTRELNSRG